MISPYFAIISINLNSKLLYDSGICESIVIFSVFLFALLCLTQLISAIFSGITNSKRRLVQRQQYLINFLGTILRKFPFCYFQVWWHYLYKLKATEKVTPANIMNPSEFLLILATSLSFLGWHTEALPARDNRPAKALIHGSNLQGEDPSPEIVPLIPGLSLTLLFKTDKGHTSSRK